ncbi:hypothetical protein [Pandoraea oxalativorans]|nr:hypothetical protein [Pandoraea oxalativorans]
MEIWGIYETYLKFIEFVETHPLGLARDFSLVMIDVAQPVAEMGSQCFWV